MKVTKTMVKKKRKPTTSVKLGTSYTFRLAKIDGNVNEHIENPEQDPRCAEVREWKLGEPNKIIYKRD